MHLLFKFQIGNRFSEEEEKLSLLERKAKNAKMMGCARFWNTSIEISKIKDSFLPIYF